MTIMIDNDLTKGRSNFSLFHSCTKNNRKHCGWSMYLFNLAYLNPGNSYTNTIIKPNLPTFVF
jgi:hypothetical protein